MLDFELRASSSAGIRSARWNTHKVFVMLISLIAAMDRNHAIGRDGAMPWHLPADLQFFKRVTLGKPVIMGRKTYDAIGRPLPGRLNIVVTRDPLWRAEGVYVVHSLEDAFLAAAEYEEVMVIGGANLYAQVLPEADRLYLTKIEGEFEADTYFPDFDRAEWREIASERRTADEKNPYPCRFVTLERVR